MTVFTARRCASAVLAVVVFSSVRLSVCQPVRQIPELYQTQNYANNATRWHSDFSFRELKVSAKFEQGHPSECAKCRWGN